MLYMSSYSTADGSMALTITFKLGTDLDQAQVLVQNRVSIAEPRLPEEVRRIGITTAKSSPDLMMVVHLLSPTERYDQLYVSNYARTRIRDLLVRLDGVGDVILFGEREYALRVWLDPEKLSAYGMTAGDVVQALREQNVQVSGGSIGGPPAPGDSAFQYTVTTDGRFSDARQFRYVIVKATETGRLVQLQDVARIELGAREYVNNSYLDGSPAVALGIFSRPGTNALDAAEQIQKVMTDVSRDFPTASNTGSSTTRPSSSRNRSTRSTRRSPRRRFSSPSSFSSSCSPGARRSSRSSRSRCRSSAPSPSSTPSASR